MAEQVTASEERAAEEVAAAPAHAGAADPVGARLSVLRAGGNRATGHWISQRRRLQRVGGWSGQGVVAQNQAEGTYSGVRRIPVEGLTPVNRALVLLSPGLDPSRAIDVLVHLHGQNTGYVGSPPRDLAANLDRIEEQLGGAGRPQLAIVLPQGSSSGADYGEFQRVNPRTYAQAALNQVQSLGGFTATPTVGAVMLSGHSGGGFAMKAILDNAAQRADVSGVVWFDAVQAESGEGARRGTTGQREMAKTLIRERITAELDAVPAGATDAAIESALRTGFSFRLYYDSAGFYAGAAGEVQTYLQAVFGERGTAPRGASAALATRIAALPAAARDALRRRYQVLPVPHGGAAGHSAALAGGGMDTLGHDNMVGSGALADAIAAMPAGRAPAAATPAAPPAMIAPPAPKATGLDAEYPERALLREAALQRAPARTLARQQAPPEDVGARLIDATVALGHADGDPPGGRTLLRRDDIRASLTGRATNPRLSATFDASVAQIAALTGSARDESYAANASGLILMLEDIFIQDAGRSGIDLLPPTRASHFRGMRWHRLDYPGHAEGEAVGPNEGEAEALSAEIARLRPERRPNQGAAAVVTRDEMTAARWRRINANLAPVEGQGRHRLFAEAAQAFKRMQQMAEYDNVDLRIFDSFRPQAVAAANAAASGNAMAVASFSSHSLGLAVDLTMSVEGGRQFQEATTRPMSNVAAMRASPVYKWMLLRGAEFGWYPFGHEPWHWEYNPDGLRARFRALVVDPPAAAPAAAAPAAH